MAAERGAMSEKRQRKSYTTQFKAKIAMEAIKGQRTINEIASHYGLSPNLVNLWRRLSIDHIPCGVLCQAGSRSRKGGRDQVKALPRDWPAQSRVGLAQKNLDYRTDQKQLLVEWDNSSIVIS